MSEYELRIINTKFEIKAEKEGDEEKQKIIGYAALFNDPAPETFGFIEKIAPGAFSEAIKNSDTRALINHNPDKVLGRNTSGTLKLKEDKTGLWYEIDPPDTSYAKDLMESMKRGDIDQSSFQFRVEVEEWDESGDVPVRTIKKALELRDVSAVTFPWYPNTQSGVRSRDEIFKKHKKEKFDQERAQNKRSLSLYKKKIKLNERKC